MFRRFRSLKVLAFAMVAVAAVSMAEMSQAVAEGYLASEEARLTTLVNEHRAKDGVRPLSTNEALRMVARRQAQRMAMAGYIYHNPDLKKEAQEAIPGYKIVAENVATTTAEGDPDYVHAGLIDSPGHHRNIHFPEFNIVGIGAMAASDGSKYYTQNFAEWYQNQPPPPPPAESKPQPKPEAQKPASNPVLKVKPVVANAVPPKNPAPATQAPTAAPTPEPTVAATATPTEPEASEQSSELAFETELLPENEGDNNDDEAVGLVQGLGGMLSRFFSKVAFWR